MSKVNDGKKVINTMQIAPIVNLKNEDDIHWRLVESDCFEAIYYDSNREILYVRFRSSGAKYMYLYFGSKEWEEFNNSDSLGSWYISHIKGHYEYQKI